MNRFIITTTINSPTEALKRFSKVKDYTLVVVGDKKTPHKEYDKVNCIYLHPDEQDKLYPDLSKAIGWNCIQRRNIGLAYAYHNDCTEAGIVDDDNSPTDDNWGQELNIGKDISCYTIECKYDVFDPVSFIGGDYVPFWHRGYPTELVKNRSDQYVRGFKKKQTFDVEAQMWTGAADVDGICRLLYGDQAFRYNSLVFPFASTKFSPFNSQNTFLTRRVIPFYSMFVGVGRMDDIYASYYLQSLGYKVVYGAPSVCQIRNPHDTVKDIEGELHGYRNCYNIIKDLYKDPESIWKHVPKETKFAFDRYRELFS